VRPPGTTGRSASFALLSHLVERGDPALTPLETFAVMLADAYCMPNAESTINCCLVSRTISRGKMNAINRTSPSVDELVSRSSDIRRVVREAAGQTERARQVSPGIVSCMRDAGLFRMMQQAIYGGYEYGFEVLVR